MIRLEQQNDWVIYLIICCIFLFIFMLRSLKRDSSILEFLLQKFADSANNFLSWGIISIVYCLLFSAAVSQFIPVVPQLASQYHILGYGLNKFGFTFATIALFHLLRTFFSYLYFAGTGAHRRWDVYYFVAGKFYFVCSLLLLVLCIVHFYFPIDRSGFFSFGLAAVGIGLVFKIVYYLAHPSGILPQKWYYKILYICTLQIIPVLVLWKVLFV